MNPTFTPFSGLSLIVHLVVIGVAKVSKLVHTKKPGAVRKPSTALRRGFNYAFSIGIILVISSVMLFSFALALTTSLHEAADEPHVKFIKSEWQALRDVEFGMLEYVAQAGERHSISVHNVNK